ncbi:MAG: PhzF family phenazine biosynthesis protein [Chloroflexota bacterium]
MSITLIQVDAFSATPFQGNPAAVCLLTQPKGDAWLQELAKEMNQPATAVLTPHEDPFKRAYRLRWFTPQVELEICGHGTLASAHVLWTEGHLRPTDTARFYTKSGVLTCSRNMQGWILMDFPAMVLTAVSPPPALNAPNAVYVGHNGDDYLVELGSETAVRAYTPDFSQLSTLDMRSLIITSPADDSQYDFVSRVFAPSLGIPEDAATGSAHCTLGPYWQQKLGHDRLLGHQLSARTGVIGVHVKDNGVQIGGKAVTVLKGNLQL